MQEADIANYSAEYRELFVQYAITMIDAQRMEALLKLFLFFLNVHHKHTNQAVTDTYLDELSNNLDHSTLIKMINRINHFFRGGNMKFMTDETRDMLERLIKIRNYLAHSYLNDNYSLFKNAEARIMLITELRNYAEDFNDFEQEFKPLVDMIMEELKRKSLWREDVKATVESGKFEELKLRLKNSLGFEG